MGILDAPSVPASRVPAAPLAGLRGVYDPRRSVYNLKPAHLRRTRAKLAGAVAGTALCRVGCAGDSITAGEKAAPYATNAWPVRMRDIFAASGVPIAGTGLIPAQSAQSGFDARWSYGAGWANFSGAPTSFLRQCSTPGSTATLTGDRPGTVVEVQYSNGSGPFTVAIDGAAPVTVTPTGGTSLGIYTVTGLADTNHTVVVTVGATGTTYLVGAGVRRTTGLLVTNAGLGGATAGAWSTTEPFRAGPALRSYSPDLVTFSLMTNDANQSVAPATYKSNMQTAITAFKAASDVLLIAAIPGNGLALDPYRAALYELADSNDLPLLDFFDRWGSYDSANGLGLMFDSLHPNATGYADLGRAVASALLSTGA